MKVVKVTSKGQVTIPIEVRERLGIDEETYLIVSVEGSEVRLKKVRDRVPLTDEDPIWGLIGRGSGDADDVAENHDEYLAQGEVESWHESS